MSVIKGRKKAATMDRQGAKLVTVSEVTIEMVRKRSYELFLARGAKHGADLADWFEAEQELHAAYQH